MTYRIDQNSNDTIGIPKDPSEPRYDLMVAIGMMEDAQESYDKARLYYDGRVTEWHANPRIADILEKSAAGYPFRLAGVPVDTLTERCRLNAVKVDDGELDNASPGTSAKKKTTSPQQKAWNEIFEDNNMESWSAYQHFMTFLYGDAYLRVLPSPEESAQNRRGVDLTYVSPYHATVVYDGINTKTAKYGVHRWHDDVLERWFADVYYADGLVQHWVTRDKGARGFSYKDWVPNFGSMEDLPDSDQIVQLAEEQHGVDGVPIKHSRTKLVYGRPVHEPAYGPANAIMKHLITQLATVDTAGWPVRMLLADPSAALDRANDNPDWDEEESGEEIPVPETGSVASSMRESPGIIQILEGIKAVATFDASDPSVLIDPVLKMYLPIMAATTRTPLYAFDQTGEAPSGKSRQVKDAPLIAHVRELQTLLTDFWEDVVKAALSIVDMEAEAVQVGWEPVLLASDLETWQMITLMLENGVPFDVVMTQTAGYDPVTVAGWETPPRPWEMEQQKMQMQHEFSLEQIRAGNVPGKSSSGGKGGPNSNDQSRAGTKPGSQKGPS